MKSMYPQFLQSFLPRCHKTSVSLLGRPVGGVSGPQHSAAKSRQKTNKARLTFLSTENEYVVWNCVECHPLTEGACGATSVKLRHGVISKFQRQAARVHNGQTVVGLFK